MAKLIKFLIFQLWKIIVVIPKAVLFINSERIQKNNNSMLQKNESEGHKKIKLSLVNSFKNEGWSIRHIDGENDQTDLVENDNSIGDGEDKRPDVDAKNNRQGRIIRGEAKVNNGDFESEHSITQFKLFSNRNLNGVKSWLVIGVPAGTKQLMEKVLDRELDNTSRENVVVWEY